jgi:putative intracellular protease/amidase
LSSKILAKQTHALAIACCLIASAIPPAPAFGAEKGKILFVASNVLDMGDPEQHDARNNLWEYAPPFHIFVMHGYEVDFVSPQGGRVEFMMDPLGISSYAIKYENFLGKTASTLKPDQVDSAQYAAVYVGGGYGRGPGGFANARLTNGEYLVKGKRVAGFPDSTEHSKPWAKQGSLLPFLVEDQLRKSGAQAENKETLADKHAVIVDQRIVSSMFLPSAALVAEEMVRLLRRRDP